MKHLGGHIEGYFTFADMNDPDESTFNARIDPFYFNIDEGSVMIDNPMSHLY